jgi:hypothetical protein
MYALSMRGLGWVCDFGVAAWWLLFARMQPFAASCEARFSDRRLHLVSKTSGARWRGSIASGSASVVSSPGACPLTGSALAYRQFGLLRSLKISALGSVSVCIAIRANARPVTGCAPSDDGLCEWGIRFKKPAASFPARAQFLR